MITIYNWSRLNKVEVQLNSIKIYHNQQFEIKKLNTLIQKILKLGLNIMVINNNNDTEDSITLAIDSGRFSQR